MNERARASAPPAAAAPGRRHSSLAFVALSLFSSSLAAPWPRLWGPFVLVDAILTPTREPSLISSQVQQGSGHLLQPRLKITKQFRDGERPRSLSMAATPAVTQPTDTDGDGWQARRLPWFTSW